ncbi:MAG TPA: sulfite exporter TauE/SafE family protein [Candidatus Binatia bacterium]|jgi:uncharacterized membrane protein YfcA|nr:sulfite exporter TauE/SafE family protein [Candidatus Binatia bacterium]
MDAGTFTLLLALGSIAAGFLGALTGLGGGVVLVPLLTLGFGVDLRYAIGASLVSVIATSSAAAASYVRDGYSNVRVGMFLEVATTIGAVVGAMIASSVPVSAVSIVFGVVLLWSAIVSLRQNTDGAGPATADRIATALRLDGSFPVDGHLQTYHVAHVPGGWGIMFIAGGLSGLLGIGSGALKVLAMDQVMGLPFKVSTTTSNFMIGVTAAASAGLYLHRGYIDPGLTMPVMLGVLLGATLGARLLAGAQVRMLRLVFGFVIMALGVQMIWHGLSGSLAHV